MNTPSTTRRHLSSGPAGCGRVTALCLLALAAGLFLPLRAAVAGGESASPAERLAAARELFDAGRYEEALAAAVDLAHSAPGTAGLDAFRREVMDAVIDLRALHLLDEGHRSRRRAMIDAAQRGMIPETFGMERRVTPAPRETIIPDGPVYALLDRPVSLHLQEASLSAIIDALADDTGVNIIAESDLGEGMRLNIRADGVPLREVLDYIGREVKVRFSFGRDLIWVSQVDPEGENALLQTRIYRLARGVQVHGDAWGGNLEALGGLGHASILTQKATVLPETRSYIEDIIELFVPPVPGANVHLDRNTHTLFIRNTTENLELIDRIVQALDVNPPQVLIEARFIEIMAADLRELGIEWVLNTPLPVTRSAVTHFDGTAGVAASTEIADGPIIRYEPFRSDQGGPHPFGPQGGFGTVREGTPSTDDQGLNLTYRGVLTEPMFSAILHALEISGRGRTLSVPRVTTINNSPAKLRNGEDLRYFEEFEAQAFALVDAANQRYTVTALIPKGKPEIQELGITLVAVPSVGADLQTVSLLLTPTISRLEGFVNYQDDSPSSGGVTDIRQVVVKLPIISRREIQTKVVVESGETVVMGGLIDTVSQETQHRVPILGSLPLIGPLFRRTEQTEQNKNLLVFVTATVLSERGESLRAAVDTGASQGRGGAWIEREPPFAGGRQAR